MKFINRISYSLFFVAGAGARKLGWIAVFALLAASAMGAAQFNQPRPRPAQAEQAAALQGEAAVRRLKTEGGYASLAVARYQTNAAAVQASQSGTIDPILTQQQKLTAMDGAANDHFGTAVALSGNTMVIGAPDGDVIGDDQGSVYVFIRGGATWTLQQKLTAQGGAANSGFGFSVAISGDTVVIGAPLVEIKVQPTSLPGAAQSGRSDRNSSPAMARP